MTSALIGNWRLIRALYTIGRYRMNKRKSKRYNVPFLLNVIMFSMFMMICLQQNWAVVQIDNEEICLLA